MQHSISRRLLSALLSLLMVLGMFPVTAFAADPVTATLVTDASTLAVGDKVVIIDATGEVALSTEQKTNNRGVVAVTVVNGVATLSETVQILTLEAGTKEGTFAFNTGSGYLYAAGQSKEQNGSKNYNYLKTKSTLDDNGSWKININATTGVAEVVAQGENGCNILKSNNNTLFSAYFSGQKDISIYKVDETTGGGTTDPTPDPEPDPEPTTVPISTALAGETGTEFTVKGVVTLVDGQNIYVQDATGGICVRLTAYSDEIALGDTIIGTGSRVDYKGLPQLGSGTFTKSEGLTLSAKETTIAALSTADICTYVTIKGLEIAAIDANYSNNWTLKDANGNTIELYKGVLGETTYAVGDKVDITAAVGCFNEDLQLRNTVATEITKVESGETPDPEPETPTETLLDKLTAAPENNSVVVIYNAANTAAMGSEASGKKIAGVTAALKEEKLPLDDAMAQLTVKYDGTSYVFINAEGKYLTSAEAGNGLSFADTLTDCGKWTLEANGEKWIIKNVGANYNGNYNQAMEYYSGFTTYGVKTTDIYLMDFYLVQEGGVLANNDKVVIYNPAYMKALSTVYNGFYNTGVNVTINNGVLKGFTAAEVWTVGVNADGTYTFSTSDGKKFSMGASYSSMPLDDVNTAWSIEPAATKDCYYIKNVARNTYVEWYADKDNWSSYYNIGDKEALFAQMFYVVSEDEIPSGDENLPAAGDKVVIYNVAAEGVLAGEGDNKVINNVAATINEEGKAVAGNGAAVFTVEKNGTYFRFYNETYGYLSSNEGGRNAFYHAEAVADESDWELIALGNGFRMRNLGAKYNGNAVQHLEYYSDAYQTYGFYPDNGSDIYEFHFYPLADDVKTNGNVVNEPKAVFGELVPAYVGQDYTFNFTVDAVFGLKEGTLKVTVDETELTANEDGSYTISKDIITGTELTIVVTGTDTKDVSFTTEAKVTVKDEPVIDNVAPAPNTETLEDKKPVISADIINAGENATVTMTLNGEAVEAVYENGKVTYTPAENMEDGKINVTVNVKRADGVETQKSWSFTVGEAQYQHYFGQLHSHTTYSDGSGTLASALEYIKNLPESANVDFVAFTDHSNYFDEKNNANPEGALYDMSLATADSQATWNEYVSTMREFNANQTEVIAIPGFEMTWSGGPGHMNTFNTPGIVSRNNSNLNKKDNDEGMRAYYALLSQTEGVDSISQFNHPGKTFGTFTDFSYWDPIIDSRIQLVEVGNGEGQIGAGGYFPSYAYYTMALDKGWHVSPTNNQDNHKGKWGNANDARDVIITDDFSEDGLYAAMRMNRMYSTEDKNLVINYTVNGELLGARLPNGTEELNINVSVYDPDNTDTIKKVEVIVNSGIVVHTWSDPADLAVGSFDITLPAEYSYYYIRVTEDDGDLAVTSPVWVGETLKLGISSVECGTDIPVTNEEVEITTTLFNSEAIDANVKALTYAIKDGAVIGTDTTGYTISANGNVGVNFKYTPEKAKVTTITVTAIVEQDGKEYTFSMDVELDVQDADKLVYIGIDAAHYNEYVAGNYKDSMGNFSTLANEYAIRTVMLKTSEDLIAACSNEKYAAIIFTAPSRRLAAAQKDPKVYSAEEIAAITEFNAKGGIVIFAGWSDNYENYDVIQNDASIKHMAATQNEVLEAIGSSIRIADDATYDDVRSAADGVDKWRLYFNTYGDSFLTEGVIVDENNPYNRYYTEVFSHYGGASIYFTDENNIPATVTPIVYGHSSTYSVDVDKDGLGGNEIPTYTYAEGDDRLVVMATEQIGTKGLIIVSGAAFMSNFEVQAQLDNVSEMNYSNYKICENLLASINPIVITPIADVQAADEEGIKFTVEGVVTSNASGYDRETAFFDCIYVQDATGGINVFPVEGNYKVGDKVRITGITSSYQGERQLDKTNGTIEKIGENQTVTPKDVTAAQINNGSVLGQLVKLEGVVVSFEKENGLVQTIMVKDSAGNVARVFIDGYICADVEKDVKNLEVGAKISVIGCASFDKTFNSPEGPYPRIRIRDRADIVCEEKVTLTVTFDAAYRGEFEDESEKTRTVNYGEAVGEFPVVTRKGHSLKGWYDEDGNKVTEETIITEDVTFTAKWEPVPCTVTFDPDGGTFKVEGQETRVVLYGDKLGALPEVEREGYTLEGWYTSKGKKAEEDLKIKAPKGETFIAKWTPNDYTITFDAGEGVADYETKVVKYGSKIGNMPSATREGYTFVCWLDANGNEVTNKTVYKVAGDSTFTAKWEPNKYTITFNANGGEVDPETKVVRYRSKVGNLPTPTFAGYTFVCWLDANGNEVTSKTVYKVAGDSTYTAKWEPNKYTITFDAGEGVADYETKVVRYRSKIGNMPSATREGYTFICWLDADGNEVTSKTVYKVIGDSTFTAKWEANDYTVTFDPNGGECDTASKTVTYDSAVGELPVPTLYGYDFIGWFDANGNEVTAATVYKTADDSVYTARWELHTFIVTFEEGEGELEFTRKGVKYGSPIGKFPKSTRNGYSIFFWLDEDNNIVTEETIVTRDMTLRAVWFKPGNTVVIGGSDSKEEESNPNTGANAASAMAAIAVLGAAAYVLGKRK